MHSFHYKNNKLHCEDIGVDEIAAKVGTPFYLYSAAALRENYQTFDNGFADIPHITCFAVKSCSNIAILGLLASMGSGADIVSGGELFRALKAGIDPDKIIYSGVAKTEAEIRESMFAGILLFNVESGQELDLIQKVARDLGTTARISFRINPDVDPDTHPYISTGLTTSKFGLPVEAAFFEYLRAEKMDHIEVAGVSCHIGSQLTEVTPFTEAAGKVKTFIQRIENEGVTIKYLDLGGGVGITYNDEQPPHPHEYARAIQDELKEMRCTLILEPGRVIAGNAGILVTEVQHTKTNTGQKEEKRFVIVDAAMNDLIRPSLYGAYHEIIPVKDHGRNKLKVDIVGPVCETGDFMARYRELPEVERGDLLAIMSSGAYGFTMSSNYNSRPRVAEVLVSGENVHLIRRREDYDDLMRHENMVELP